MPEIDLIQSKGKFELFPDLLKAAEGTKDDKKTEMTSDSEENAPEEKKVSESPEKPAAESAVADPSSIETPVAENKKNVALPRSVFVHNNKKNDIHELTSSSIEVVTVASTGTAVAEPSSPNQQQHSQQHSSSSSNSPQNLHTNPDTNANQQQQEQQPSSTSNEENDKEETKNKETEESNISSKEEDTKNDPKDTGSSNPPTAPPEESRGQYQITLQVPMPEPVVPPPPQQSHQQQLEQQEPTIERQQPSRGRPQQRTTAAPSASHNVYSSNASTTEIVHSMFGPSVGLCWGDFSCQYNHIRGRLYASTEAVLFYSNLFGFEKKLCLRYEDILQMELYRSTSIQISVEEKPMDNNNNKNEDSNRENDNSSIRTTNSFHNDISTNATYNYVFKAFADRIETLQLLIDLWRKSEGEDNIESHDTAATETANVPLSLEATSLLDATRSLSPLFGGGEDNETASLQNQRQQQQQQLDQPQSQNQQNEPPMNPPVPPSILRSSKLSTPPTKPSAPPTRTTTPRKIFSSESFTGSRRSKSLPPLHRRKRVERSNSDGVADGGAASVSGDNDELNLDQTPTESDRAAWEATKNTVAPCIKDVGIEVSLSSNQRVSAEQLGILCFLTRRLWFCRLLSPTSLSPFHAL